MPYLHPSEEGATFVRIVLPSGNQAVYEIASVHLTASTRLQRAEFIRMHARQCAHQAGGVWFKPGGWVQLVDVADEFAALPLIDD